MDTIWILLVELVKQGFKVSTTLTCHICVGRTTVKSAEISAGTTRFKPLLGDSLTCPSGMFPVLKLGYGA
jgi:hypothetical protein